MQAVITLVAPVSDRITSSQISATEDAVATAGPVATQSWLAPDRAVDLTFETTEADLDIIRRRTNETLAAEACDFAVQPLKNRRKRLFLADMDATLIGQECIDELAVVAGIGEHIARITERTMRGEIDFEDAMNSRVGLLKGLPEAALGEVYEQRITLNPGGRTCVRTMAANGVLTRLVSGGFTFFASRVAEALGFDRATANVLEIADSQLTGRIVPPIFGRQGKLDAMTDSCTDLGISASKVLAVGDGANDLAMITAAGLGVAYYAKPVVGAAADARIDHSDLTTLLFFQGYKADEFVTD